MTAEPFHVADGNAPPATPSAHDRLNTDLVGALTDAERALTESNRRLIDAQVALIQAERRAAVAEANEKRLTHLAGEWTGRARFAERIASAMHAAGCDQCPFVSVRFDAP